MYICFVQTGKNGYCFEFLHKMYCYKDLYILFALLHTYCRFPPTAIFKIYIIGKRFLFLVLCASPQVMVMPDLSSLQNIFTQESLMEGTGDTTFPGGSWEELAITPVSQKIRQTNKFKVVLTAENVLPSCI